MNRQTSRNPRFKFFRDIFSELKKVTWPTRQEATYLTFIVIVTCIVVGLILGLIDYGFAEIAKLLVR